MKEQWRSLQKPLGVASVPQKALLREASRRAVDFDDRHLWFEFCTPAAHHHAQACMNIGFSQCDPLQLLKTKVFANRHHQCFLSPVKGVGVSEDFIWVLR